MQINQTNVHVRRIMNTRYFVIVAAMTAVLIGATAFVTADSAFAGEYKKSQATSQVNECGNGVVSINVGCQNADSQIQGDENIVSLLPTQSFPQFELETEPGQPPVTESEPLETG
jgi:hypothetical protein